MNKPIRFDRHARRRMKWRGISEEEVIQVLQQPDVLENSIKGRITKEFISKTTLTVIPACLESFRLLSPQVGDRFGIVKKDAGQASMTE